ncbi:hypothetical protein EpCFBP13511_07240 [Erwinia persicina]|uniref:Uncharacterized protein n=1 Tax=Erwinia persicina TaxID=55211 RepID=A0A4U3FFF4_9GAMM|nr:hypothetical protein EpCFBP13511_07240 [Erwinia persicina]HBI08013.1 hypothetical protein [Erwinia persicina]
MTYIAAVSVETASAQESEHTCVREDFEHCPARKWSVRSPAIIHRKSPTFPQVDPRQITEYNAALNDSGIPSWPTLP